MMHKNQKSSSKRKRRILLMHYQNLHSILMIGKDNFVMPKINQQLLSNYGLNLIMMVGHSGEFIISDIKDKVLLDI